MPASMGRTIIVAGLDPSLRNWGIALGVLDLDTRAVTIRHLDLIQPVLSSGKQVRQNSQDLESAFQLYKGAAEAISDAAAVFVEVPVGSQSSRAMASYGICVGVLGSLRANSMHFFEVTPTEVKLAGAGHKNATKDDMIEWARRTHPEANWPLYTQKGEQLLSAAKAEHMADAVAAIHAGIAGNAFQQSLPFYKLRHANFKEPA